MKEHDSIFLVNSHEGLERVPHQPYADEDKLQVVIDSYPELLVGDLINPEDPPRWLVVKREAGVPGSGEGGHRWSVDHLFLDQYGRPTFVEVKRSSDSRIRREVVGQMLDYAANAQKYWPPNQIRALLAEKCGDEETLNTELQQFLSSDENPDAPPDLEAYWNNVEQNLRNGQVRLLFVADEIPAELRRIIEFLNENMPLVEVLGVEIRQYKNQSLQALVPRVVGQTESARQQKKLSSQDRKSTTQEDFLSDASEKTNQFFEQLISQAKQRGFFLSWGTKGFSIRMPKQDGQIASFFYGYPPGAFKSPVYVFQAYLGYLGDTQIREAFQKALVRHIPFQPTSGKHTLEIRLDNEGLSNAQAGLPEVLDIAKQVANGEMPDPATE